MVTSGQFTPEVFTLAPIKVTPEYSEELLLTLKGMSSYIGEKAGGIEGI